MSKSEEKRLKSLTEKKAAYKQQKNAVKLALSSIDSVRNNKIVFDDDNVSISPKYCMRSTNINVSDHMKQLFSDDEENEEYIATESFKIKNQFEGEKGQKLLELQSRFMHDERFVLDSRFVDNEDVGDQDSTNGDTDPKEMEKDHQLKILDSVLGTNSERKRESTNKPKFTHKPIVRFDPSKEDHLKFEIKKEANEENVKRKKRKSKIPEKNEDSNDIINAPVVSKETFYKVTDSLKQALQEKESFSLLQAFGTSDVEEKENPQETVETIRANTLNHGRNPFKYDSSDSEDEEEINVSEIPQKSNNIGLWKENFFFKADDHRLKEGLKFISKIQDEEKTEQFSQIRRELKQIARTKLRNNQRNIRPFQKKLGGRKFNGNAKFNRNKRKR